MNKPLQTILIITYLFLAGLLLFYFINPLFVPDESFNGFTGDNNDTIIITSSTGDMKGLEVGIASYAGKEGIPLILASKTIPYPLNEWFSMFKDQANIKKVILVGPISNWQIYSLKRMNLEVERIDGDSKAEILTQIAEKTYNTTDTVIITASDPSASLLGALIDVPVFVVAEPGKYTSAEALPAEYGDFISKYNVKNVIIVGNVSQGIMDNLTSENLTVEEIKGNDSFQTSVLVSDRIIDIQKDKGVAVDSAYCGFYGELPSIVPLAVKNHSIILIDPTLHMDETVKYLEDNDIDQAIITRNGPADYLQMEEPDFVSSTLINKMHSAGIKTYYLTNFRTINEATGLFETKIMAAEQLLSTSTLQNNDNYGELNSTNLFLEKMNTGSVINSSEYPPILDVVFKGGNWKTNTGSQLTVIQIGLNTWYYSWKGIHPYIWQRISDDEWYCYSGSQYSWHWIHNKTENSTITDKTQDTWTVEYLSKNKVYNRVYWIKEDDIWEEVHSEGSYNWELIFGRWVCRQNGVNESFILSPVIYFF